MADLPDSAMQPNQSLKLLVKGFAGFDMRLLEGVIKLSRRRNPSLELVSDPAMSTVDVVMVDGKDEEAVAWAAQQQHWLARQPVVWVDSDASLLPGHTGIQRPVQWTHLPVLLSCAIDEATHNAKKDDISFDLPTPPKRQAKVVITPLPPAALPGGTLPSARLPGTVPPPEAPPPARIPEVSPPAPIPKAPANPATQPPPAERPRGIPLLVVDDSAAVRAHLSSVLDAYGYQVTAVDSGEAGVVAVNTNTFACVLMDVLMPGIDGYDACRRIKSMGKGAATPPVVMLTSKSSPFDKIRGKMAGCDAYLTKPVEKAHLMEVLAQLVRRNSV